MQQTIFIDIDGCIFKHHGGTVSDVIEKVTGLLPGVKEKIGQWFTDGHYICLTTARPECWRARTEIDLEICGIPYHQLVMGIGHGIRTIINDAKPNLQQTAFAITVERNKGFEQLELPTPKYREVLPTSININIATIKEYGV